MRQLILVLFIVLFSNASNAGNLVQLPNDVASGFGNVWLKSMENGFKKHGYKIVSSPEPVRLGDKAIKFEVRPGDCGNNGGWDDCKNDRERHELSQIKTLQKHGDVHWYAWSIYLPTDIEPIYPVRVHLGQFHQVKNNVLFLLSWVPYGYHEGYVIDNQVPGNGHTYQMQTIVPSDTDNGLSIKGRWIDILIHAKWSHNKDGFFNIYADQELKYEWKGQTIAKGDRSHFKFGLYRSFVSRFPGPSNPGPPAQVVYYDEVRQSSSLKKVDRVGIARIQEILEAEGLYNSNVDGLWGPNTMKAVNAYLAKKQLPEVTDYTMGLWSSFR
ncbi:MAG: heparin lyase I family protein [Alphaproteobacteria bacterium]|nr:heparin lyase I family protein [Alphaproteobacteria bacterium]